MAQSINLDDFIGDLRKRTTVEKEKGVKVLSRWAGKELAAPLDNPAEALRIASEAKKLHIPCENLDYIRARAFLALNRSIDAIEALKEELRWFPANAAARALLDTLVTPDRDDELPLEIKNFDDIHRIVKPYTMVGPERLRALYDNAHRICRSALCGNFVECGVAGGGSSALLATVLKQYPGKQARLFCCDSFCGMPDPTPLDVHQGEGADASGWGSGTCSAPEASVRALCDKLGAGELIRTVKGFFEDTLPEARHEMGPIAFLHVDGDWYSSTKAILENLYDQLLPGAYVQVDDYGHWDGCRQAVQDFFASRNLAPELKKIDYTGVWFTKNS